MKIAIYGGSFNPPHNGHREAAATALRCLKPDRLLVVPDRLPPHKELSDGSPSPAERMELCRLAFASLPDAEVSDIELRREGASYTAETIEAMREQYPNDELTLILGADMLYCFEQWYRFRYLLTECSLAVLPRLDEDIDRLPGRIQALTDQYGARITMLPHVPVEISSSEIRARLSRRLGAELVPQEVYAEIIRRRYYEAQPELGWLREQSYALLKPKRIAHVAGCESTAVELAKHWGADPELAAEAAILHDATKKLSFAEQLNLCREYGIILHHAEDRFPPILHAITGAELAVRKFGVSGEVASAIRWHTTGKPDMTLLEKILYLADGIEPNRDYPGIEKLRTLAVTDIDAAMSMALAQSLAYIRERNEEPFAGTVEAADWYAARNT